jgi:hypothetical protein
MELAQFLEWGLGGFSEQLIVGHSRCERKLVNSRADSGHNPLGTGPVKIFILVVAASEIEEL